MAYILDDTAMVNHSKTPTLCDSDEDDDHKCYATRDIHEGEELTQDYKTYKRITFHKALYNEYDIDEDYLY